MKEDNIQSQLLSSKFLSQKSLAEYSKNFFESIKCLKVKRSFNMSFLITNVDRDAFDINILAYFIKHFKSLNEERFKIEIKFLKSICDVSKNKTTFNPKNITDLFTSYLEPLILEFRDSKFKFKYDNLFINDLKTNCILAMESSLMFSNKHFHIKKRCSNVNSIVNVC